MKDIELRHCIISERTREAITHPIFGYDPEGQQQIFTDADATAEKILNITGEKGPLNCEPKLRLVPISAVHQI